MTERYEIGGVTLAVIGHAGLVAALVWFSQHAPDAPASGDSQPIQVTLADDVALVSAAPDPSPVPPAAGSPPDAQPDPQPQPDEPAPPSPEQPTPAKIKPKPSLNFSPDAFKQDPDPARANPQSRRNGSPSNTPPNPANNRGPGTQNNDSDSSKSQATMTGQAAQNIGSAIQRQIQPCADRQIDPGPGANRIKVRVQLHLNRDGSLIDRPTIIGTPTGVDENNQRYVARVKDLAIATFMGCSPLRGLPVELWDVPKGWRNFIMNYHLPD